MKIAHLEFGRNDYGGAQQVRYLLNGLHADRHRHWLVAAADSAMHAWASDNAVPHVALRYAGEHDLGMVSRVAGWLRANEIDLVHVHSRRGADWMGPLAAVAAGSAALLTRRVDHVPGWPLRWMMRHRYRRVVAISHAIHAVLESAGVPEDRLLTVRSAVDAARYAPPAPDGALARVLGTPPSGPVIGVIAQLIPRKGHRFLLEGLPGLVRKFPGLRVVCFGKGALREALAGEVAAAGLAECVHFAGFRDDLAEVLPALDLVVHPALQEGLGVALLQAAAAGVPVVGFAAGGVREAVAHEHTGLLVPPGDAIALAAAIARVLDDPVLRRTLGANAQRRVAAEFSISTLVQRYDALYDVLEGELT